MIFEWNKEDSSILTMHFRFEVSEEHISMISEVEGIDCILKTTRYSIKVIIGGAFSQQEVEDNLKRLFQ